jgi:adenine C2-methylase RlmN of 23S rRNA A2503 and tRNA A37
VSVCQLSGIFSTKIRIIPRIHQLGRDAPKISLALSLHAPTQETRLKIVPTAKAYRVDRIIQACVEFINSQNEGKPVKDGKTKKGRHLLVEYVLIRDVNGIFHIFNVRLYRNCCRTRDAAKGSASPSKCNSI